MSVEQERAAREQAEQRAAALERDGRLRDAISARGLTGERAEVVRRLVDQTAEDIGAAVDATISGYAKMLADPEPAPPPRPRMVRKPGPTTPPAALGRTVLPKEFVTPEEFLATPRGVRMSEEFQKRVAASRPYWRIPFRRSLQQLDNW